MQFKKIIFIIVVLGFLLLLNHYLPSYLNPYLLQILILIGINIMLAVSLNLINGFTGQFSIGHAGFMAIGGYASAFFTYYFGVNLIQFFGSFLFFPWLAKSIVFIFALILGGALAALAGLVVGIPSLRLKGDYLAIATLGFGEIIRVIILNIDAVGGARGFADIPGYTNLFWVLFFVLISILVVRNLVYSTHGRAFLSIREDEVAAEAMGINTTYYKVYAFVIGAFFAGIAGGLFGHYLMYLHTNSFTFMKSIEVIIMVVLGGMGSITGSILAAIIMTILPEFLRVVKDYRMVIYSLTLVILMLTRPQGIFGVEEFSLRKIKNMFVRF
ncbi:MAG: branched-chain amino acid ABC transporter permease, partial [candidate division Zixibacteria bacterium]|nr:branched-chain amino acid ABC transporter permease [candidate division Zixibacteria bacterium]